MDYLTTLPVDLFIQVLTYLPFDDVINVCSINSRLHYYGLNYNIKWKRLIDNTFSFVYNYNDKLNKIWSKLNLPKNTYNYLVYTKLINLLDPITQLIIYYHQGDTKFNDIKIPDIQRFLAMFLLNKPIEMKKYAIYISILKEEIGELNLMVIQMAQHGNVNGIQLLEKHGANIHAWCDEALNQSAKYGHLDVVRYLSKNKVNNYERVLTLASCYGHVDIVKYSIKQGANIHHWDDSSLLDSSKEGHLDVVKYLIEKGSNIHAQNDEALRSASQNGHLDVVRYLVEQGANIYAQNDAALKGASEMGHLNI